MAHYGPDEAPPVPAVRVARARVSTPGYRREKRGAGRRSSERPGAGNPLKRSDSKVTVGELVQHCLSVCEILEVGDGWLVITFFHEIMYKHWEKKKDGTRNQNSSKKRFDKSASRLGCFGRNSRLVVWA